MAALSSMGMSPDIPEGLILKWHERVRSHMPTRQKDEQARVLRELPVWSQSHTIRVELMGGLFSPHFGIYHITYIYLYIYIYVCVCVFAFIYTYIYIYINYIMPCGTPVSSFALREVGF